MKRGIHKGKKERTAMRLGSLTRMLAAALLAILGVSTALAAGRRLAPLDMVQVMVINQPELTSQVRVAPDGTISLPYAGRIRVAGMSEDEVAARIRSALRSRDVVKDPEVVVTVSGFGEQASVLGAVRQPGAVTLDRPSTLLEVLAKAGGLAQNGGQITIRRRARGGVQTINVDSRALTTGRGSNPMIFNGDEIVVDEAPVFFIYGYVNRPGMYPLQRPLSLQQAIASSGGLSELGSESRIEIKRKRADGTMIIVPGDMDAPIHPSDTIVVKERWF